MPSNRKNVTHRKIITYNGEHAFVIVILRNNFRT